MLWWLESDLCDLCAMGHLNESGVFRPALFFHRPERAPYDTPTPLTTRALSHGNPSGKAGFSAAWLKMSHGTSFFDFSGRKNKADVR